MWFSGFDVVTPSAVLPNASLRVEAGTIAEIVAQPMPEGKGGAVIRAQAGQMLLPGFVDMHGDMVEREVEPRPGARMPFDVGLRDLDRRLAAAGVTTAFAAVSFNQGSAYGHLRSFEHTSAMIRALRHLRPDLGVDHRVHARFEVTFPRALGVLEELIAEGAIDLVSLTDHTPGQGQYRDLEKLIEIMVTQRKMTRPEAETRLAERIARQAPPAEELARTLTQITTLCRRHAIAVASHDDDTARKVAMMRDFGATISEFPVTAEAARAARAQGMLTVMGAPNALLGKSNTGNLSARDAHAEGLLDMLCSDYHPSAVWPAVLGLAETDPGGLPGALRLVTQAPARALGLSDRGALAPGLLADLVVADRAGSGRVRATWRAGRLIHSDGALTL
jgi:alpha-D-ribose 1-methylphosphonate 5-triphosphate diphosphatase